MKSLFAVICGLLLVTALNALDTKAGATSISPPPPQKAAQPPEARSETDRDGDGVADFFVYFDKSGKKEREETDYNNDGKVDDYLYYENGVPVREEIDSNYDGKIDVWVYLSDGIYVQRYERDLNGDGVPDVVKDFGKTK